MWKGDVKKEDYHSEMNSQIMIDWLKTKLLPNVRGNAVLVLDRAPYHTMFTEDTKGPASTWNKSKLAEYVLQHSDAYTMHQLLHEVHQGHRGRGMLKTA
jgi:hypothetical protein